MITATDDSSTLSLHDALPISRNRQPGPGPRKKSGVPTLSRTVPCWIGFPELCAADGAMRDRKSTRLNSSHVEISYAVFCLKKKNKPFFAVYYMLLNRFSSTVH